MSFRCIAESLVVLVLITLSTAGCFSRNSDRRTTGEEPFFQKEEGLAEHGKKTISERIQHFKDTVETLNNNSKYVVINRDEPYADAVCDIIIAFENLKEKVERE